MINNPKQNRPKLRKNVYRKQRKNRKPRKPLNLAPLITGTGLGIIAIAWILVLAAAYDGVINYRGFRAKQITITGQNRLTESDILKQSGISAGDNIFKVNLTVARDRLLTNPWIRNAEVARILPDKIQIRIHEQQPLAVVSMTQKYLMNTEGEIFKHLNGEKDVLPVITGLSPQDIHVAGRPPMKTESNPHKAVMSIIRLAMEPNSVLPFKDIKQILVDREIGLTLLTSGAVKSVKIGYDDYAEKISRMNDVFKYLNEKAHVQCLESMDLLNLSRIVIKPAAANVEA